MDVEQIPLLVANVLHRHVQPGQRLTVGLSGGVDSVVALHVLKQVAASLSFELAAHHVNHRINPHADAWMDFCAGLCRSWDVPFGASILEVPRHTGKGLEAAARAGRYAALGALISDFIVLAHHQDDQAETLLLQLLRGAGVRGLSSMAEVRGQESEVRNQEGPGPAFLRPLLAVSRADIEAYARQQDLRWIEDESNADTGYSRNFLRREVLPLIEGRFPAYRSNFASAALHCGEASELLDDLATIDARQMIRDGRLAVDALASLSPPRSKNLLRYFIHSHGLPMPDQDRLREMLRQLVTARDDAQVCLVHGGRELRRFNGQLYLLQPQSALTAEAALCWQGQPGLALAQLGGSLHFERTRGTGVAAHLLLNKPYSIRFRRGGERLRLRACGPSRSLKNLFQESALPPWERERLPLLFFDDTLAVVPGIGVHAPFQCPPDEAGVLIHWLAGDRDN